MKGKTRTFANVLRHVLALALLSAVIAAASAIAAEREPAREPAQEPALETRESRSFWVPRSHPPSTYRQARAELKMEGARTLVYAETGLHFPPNFLQRIQERLEHHSPEQSLAPELGLLPLAESVFAPLPHLFAEPKLQVLFARLGQRPGQHAEGFQPYDQMTRARAAEWGAKSNEGNLIYVNWPQPSEEAALGEIAHGLQHLLGHGVSPQSTDRWLLETLAEAGMLVGGYFTDQAYLDTFAQSPELYPLVTTGEPQYGAQLLFASFLLDSQPPSSRPFAFLTRTFGQGRQLVEDLFQRESATPFPFDVVFTGFLSYVFESQARQLPYSLVKVDKTALRMPAIPAYATIKSFPAELSGRLMPYSFLAVDLPFALPSTAVVEVEAVRAGAQGCGLTASVLWKPVHATRIAVYAVGCEPRDQNDILQFRLRVLDKPSFLTSFPLKITP